jgi:serine/threonine protein kinase
MSVASLILTLLAVAFGLVLLIVVIGLGVVLLGKILAGIGALVSHVFSFIFGVIGDGGRIVGSLVLLPIFALLVTGSVLIGRWSAAGHYGRAFSTEMSSVFGCCYRILIGRPLTLIGLRSATEGLEQRLPQVMAAAPGRDKPSKKRVGMFEGYTIVGSLQGGGSGGKLYIAEPDAMKRAAFERRGLGDLDRVVIKVFSLNDGSSLPQILRESRSLDAAKKLGLVLEHSEEGERFFYVMRYVPGDSLALVTQRMHAESGGEGLSTPGLQRAAGYIAELLDTLHGYHSGGLWHKDVKPDNIIIEGEHAHLVDFGLVTPLRSAMTLTTHGTEYFRDPELVRQALRGVKVNQIDGAKFDVYAAGAVLYSVIENSFPAHGGLSQITKRCPEALRWVVRRAMAEYDQRYSSAAEMLADLDAIRGASDPFALRPADLPSMRGAVGAIERDDSEPGAAGDERPARAAFTPTPPSAASAAKQVAAAAAVAAAEVANAFSPPASPARVKPKLTLTDWWSGRYRPDGSVGAGKGAVAARTPTRVRPAPGSRAQAADQIANARARAAQTRQRARARMNGRRAGVARQHQRSSAVGAAIAVVFFLMLFGGAVAGALLLMPASNRTFSSTTVYDDGTFEIHRRGMIDPMPETPATPEVSPSMGKSLGVSMLVVSDLAYPLNEQIEAEIMNGIVALRNEGVELLGDLVTLPSSLDAEESERQINLLAEAERRRGSSPIDSVEFLVGVHDLLDAHDELDMVLWLASNPKDESTFRYALVSRERDSGGVSDEHTLGVILDTARLCSE